MSDVEMAGCPEEQECMQSMHSRQNSTKSTKSGHGRLSMSKNLRRRYVCAVAVLLGVVMGGIIIFGIVRAMGSNDTPKPTESPDTLEATVEPTDPSETPITSEPVASESPELSPSDTESPPSDPESPPSDPESPPSDSPGVTSAPEGDPVVSESPSGSTVEVGSTQASTRDSE